MQSDKSKSKKPESITEGFLYPVKMKRIPNLREIIVKVVINK